MWHFQTAAKGSGVAESVAGSKKWVAFVKRSIAFARFEATSQVTLFPLTCGSYGREPLTRLTVFPRRSLIGAGAATCNCLTAIWLFTVLASPASQR
jgi:hypothetical protein